MGIPQEGVSNVALELAEALGFDTSQLRGFTLRVYADEIVMVTAEQFVTSEQLDKLIPIIKKYELKEMDNPKDNGTNKD